MENSNIHKSLLELEDSLKDLQSARNQVNNFSERSEQMITAFTKILHNLESLQTKFEKENAHLLNQLTKKYEKVSNTISSKSDTLEEKSTKYIDMLSSSYVKVQQKISDLEYSINDAKDKINNNDFNKSLKDFELKLETVNNSIQSYRKVLDDFKDSFNYVLQNEIKRNRENYNNLISKTNSQINESNNILKETTDSLKNQKNNIDELGKNVDAKIDALYHIVSNSESKIVNLIENYNSLRKQNKTIVGIAIGVSFMCLLIIVLILVR